MCGIVGAILDRPRALSTSLLSPLQLLEYRGYDSCGVAYVAQDAGYVFRAVGAVPELEKLVDRSLPIDMGIAHTRWATHGPVSIANSHPQVSNGEVFVVHNGVFDNHAELHEKLVKLGYVFTSETDTEVLAHLVHYYLKRGPLTLTEAVDAALQDLTGQFSFLVLYPRTHEIVGVCRGRPLLLLENQDGLFISSDVTSFEGQEPGALTILGHEGSFVAGFSHANGLRYLSIEPSPKPPTPSAYAPPPHGATAFDRRTQMEIEIYQQPLALASLYGSLADQLDLLKHLGAGANVCGKLNLIGCGTSHHAAQVAKLWVRRWGGRQCHVETFVSSELVAEERELLGLTVLISQSGETADTLSCLPLVKGSQTVAMCNVEHSELARRAQHLIPLKAGTERSVASTKAFTAQLLALLALVRSMVGEPLARLNETQQAIEAMELCLPKHHAIARAWAEQLVQPDAPSSAVFLGRGTFLPIAAEGALKLLELTYIPALTYPMGELKHGPLALVEAQTPVIACFSGREPQLDRVFSSLKQVEARGGVIHLVTDYLGAQAASSNLRLVREPMVIESVGEDPFTLAPVLAAPPLQLFALELALRLGRNVDRPRNLAKSVTVE